MKAIEEVDVEKLIEVSKAVNEVVDNKIEVVGVATVDLIKSFTVALESLTDEQQDKIPEAVDFYNDLYANEAGDPAPAFGPSSCAISIPASTDPADPPADDTAAPPPASGKGKTTKKKAPAAAKKKKAPAAKKEPKEKKEPRPKDEYGFGIGTKNNLFMLAIKEKPMKMSEVKELAWNEKKLTFYEIFKKLRAEGKVDLDSEGRMCIK